MSNHQRLEDVDEESQNVLQVMEPQYLQQKHQDERYKICIIALVVLALIVLMVVISPSAHNKSTDPYYKGLDLQNQNNPKLLEEEEEEEEEESSPTPKNSNVLNI